MKAGPIDIGTLLQNRNRYCVPIYQRHYVWNKDSQWQPFWLEVRTKAIERLSGRPQRFSHFMGAIVLESRGKPSVKQVPSFQVVDGQQRLTTFQLFLTAARHYAININHSSAADNIKRYVLNSDPSLMEEPDIEVYKVWPTEADREMFINIVSSNYRVELKELYGKEWWYKKRDQIYTYKTTPNLLGAYGYFYDQIKYSVESDYLLNDLAELNGFESGKSSQPDSDSDIPPELKLDSIWQALLEEFKVVEIILDEGDDAQVIFETLNDRGEPLLAADLVRNNIFHRADAARENAEKLFSQHWKPFEDGFWSEEDKQGRYKKHRIEFFLANFIAGKISEDVTLSKLFSEYKAFVLQKNSGSTFQYTTVEAEIRDLAKYGSIYRELIEQQPKSPLSDFSRQLKPWDVTTVYPLVLRLWENTSLSMNDKVKAFETVLAFIARRAICNLTTKNYNKFFLNIIRHLDDSEWSLNRLNNYLLSQTAASSRFPTNKELFSVLKQSQVYTQLGAMRTKVILIQVEKHMHGKYQELNISPERLSIEHIMPQSWNEHWPLDSGIVPTQGDFFEASFAFALDDQSEVVKEISHRNNLIHNIGNLTLVTREFNSRLSNREFGVKRQELANQSVLMLNKEISATPEWGNENIQMRSKNIAKLIAEIWPRPIPAEG